MRQLARWGILIGAFIIAVVVYGVWKQFDSEMGGGFISVFFRGAVVFSFLVWVWHATKKLGEKMHKLITISAHSSVAVIKLQISYIFERLEMCSMDKVFLHLFTILVLVVAAPAQAMTCGQFNALGVKAKTVDQVVNTSATEAQVTEYKNVIASHAGDLAFTGFSARAKALQLSKKNNQLTMLVRESLAMTRTFCFDRANDPMKTVAIEQFDFLLDAIAKKLNL